MKYNPINIKLILLLKNYLTFFSLIMLGACIVVGSSFKNDNNKSLNSKTTLVENDLHVLKNITPVNLLANIKKTVPYILNVPADYPTIDSAMSFLLRRTLTDTVSIRVADGTYRLDKAIVLNHENGNLIKLIGNPSNPAMCKIIADSYHSAFVINNGHSISLVSGFQFIGQGDVVVPPFKDGPTMDPDGLIMGDGLAAYEGSFVKVTYCDFRKWLHGCSAWGGSTIVADHCTASNNWDSGFFAYNSSAFFANECVSNTSSSGKGGLGFGFLGEMSSSMFFQHCSANDNEQGGFYANKGSSFIIRGSSAAGNHAGLQLRSGTAEIDNFNVDGNDFGFYFEDNSSARVHRKLTANNNKKRGVYLTDNSTLAIDAALSASNNQLSGIMLDKGSRFTQIDGVITIENNGYEGINIGSLSYVYLKPSSANNISHNGLSGFGYEKNFTPQVNTWSANYSYIQTDSIISSNTIFNRANQNALSGQYYQTNGKNDFYTGAMKGDSNFHLFNFNINEDVFNIDRQSGAIQFKRPLLIINPTSSNEAATKQYVDDALIKANKKQRIQIEKLEEQLRQIKALIKN